MLNLQGQDEGEGEMNNKWHHPHPKLLPSRE